MVKPIKPSQVIDKLGLSLPDYVTRAVNNLIARNWSGRSSCFKYSDLKREINSLRESDTLEIVNFPTNFEPVYENAGWKVVCDRPGYNESYETNWTFTKKS